ncbi:MFS transporter [Paenibacillus mendelii]|uniref:MFS transporter n=1 Tax=Paenibacillus mendelii TaxID=206163 RepID=A0ABV6J9H2_9BACL|nr:MFS transporter [Paenibacillus mendelii]MCQ6559794.1 MFS transporter [Paenibacillus mendelii]
MSRPWFHRLQGNSRGCLVFEPLFLIPYSMYTTYATIYMYELGLGETAIGWITTISLIVQVFSSFISGYLTDRMGRKFALLYFDLISWSVATLLWMVTQNVWMFVAAAIVNGFQRVPHTAFYCLLVEDTEPKERTYVFTILQFIGVVGGLFAPLGGLLVHHYSLVPGVRIMYGIAFVCMTLQFIGRHMMTRETDMGKRKMREARELGLKESLGEYMSAIRSVLMNRPLLLVFGVYMLFNFQMTMKGTYLSLYLADYLHIDSDLISLFPALSSVIMLLTMWLLMPRIPERLAQSAMNGGFVLSVISTVMLIAAPAESLIWVGLSTILAAVGTMISSPYLEAQVANAIDDNQRAKIFSILSVLVLLVISPSGIIGGWTYQLDPRIPFLLVAAAFGLSIVLLLIHRGSMRASSANL